MEKNTLTASTIVIENDMKHNGETVLTYKIEYPAFKSSLYQMSLSVINRYYEAKALEYQSYLENELFGLAVEQYQESVKRDYPVRTFEALVVYQLTYAAGCILSLYFDRYEYTGGAHGNTTRYSQTWNLQKCRQLQLGELFGCGLDYREYIFEQAKAQIEKEPEFYFEDYGKLLAQTFNADSFYATPEGIVVYFQQYDIAPYASGIKEFLIPYTNCVRDPQKTCFVI